MRKRGKNPLFEIGREGNERREEAVKEEEKYE